MTPDFHDFFWVYPAPPPRVLPVQLAQRQDRGNVVNRDALPGVILYPALCTPEIVWGQEKVELLIAFRKGEIPFQRSFFSWLPWARKVDEARLKGCINRQLKVCRGLNPAKPYADGTLVQDPSSQIGIGKIKDGLSAVPLSTESRFHGLLHRTAVEFYKKKGFTEVYWVSLPHSVLEAQPPQPRFEGWRNDVVQVGGRQAWSPHGSAPNRDGELLSQDYLIWKGVEDKKAGRMAKGQYGFTVGAQDASVGVIDVRNPVQSFHPVCHYAGLQAVNIGHMSDVHINSRQQMLAKSPCRLPNHPGHRADNREIGSFVNIASKNTKELLGRFKDDGDIDAVVLTGDLIDYIENVHHPAMGTNQAMGADEVRDAVDMGQKGYGYRQRYKDNVDFLVFYSLVTDYYRNQGRPVYVVTGNHDCYKEAQGIYPMLFGSKKGTDKNVPANHNLTIYEACAIFGPSYHRFGHHGKVTGMAGSGFDPKHLGWIHKVLTPFADFSVQTPSQALVGLGWGDAENMVGSCPKVGLSYLPLATTSVSGKQLTLMAEALSGTGTGKKMVLFSHFAFASYINAMTELQALRGSGEDTKLDRKRRVSLGGTFSFREGEMGTFALNRAQVYGAVMADDLVACVLTGHTHRRAMYTLQAGAARNDESHIGTKFHRLRPEATPVGGGAGENHPIIVCDASGSLARRNRRDEFGPWGNSQCSGVKVRFDNQGRVDRVNYVPVGRRPRFAVALSYQSYKVKPFIDSLRSEWFWKGDQQRSVYRHEFRLKSEWLEKWKEQVEILWMRLYWMYGEAWQALTLLPDHAANDGSGFRFRPQGLGSNRLLDNARASNDTFFVSIQFDRKAPPQPGAGPLPEQIFDGYDFESPWTFPAKLKLSNGLFKAQFSILPGEQWPADLAKASELMDP